MLTRWTTVVKIVRLTASISFKTRHKTTTTDLDHEKLQRQSLQNALFLKWRNLEFFVFPQRDCDSLYAAAPDYWTANKPPKTCYAASSIVVAHAKMFHEDGTEAERRSVGLVAEVKFTMLALDAFLCTASSGAVSRLSFE